MTGAYVAAAVRLGWLIRRIEDAFLAMDDGAAVSGVVLRRTIPGRLPTHDELDAALRAFADLAVLVPLTRGMYKLRRGQLLATEEYRRGVFDALALMSPEVERRPVARLCVALPPGLPAQVEEAIRLEADDLRSTLIDLIAGSKYALVLAAPFWDAATVVDLAQVLEKRLQAGVSVSILGRFGRKTDPAVKGGLAQLGHYDRCKILQWYERSDEDIFGSRTFHFKAVVSDVGERAYLGTANFTASSLRSRMEIGCTLVGAPALQLARLLDTVVSLARPAPLSGD